MRRWRLDLPPLNEDDWIALGVGAFSLAFVLLVVLLLFGG